MVRVGVYNRCSTEEEAQINALEIQASESLEIIENKHTEGWILQEQYIESESGTTVQKRKEYLRMIEDIEAGRFDIIMVKSIDRLARNTKDWYLFLDCLVRNNTRLYLYLENKFYQSEDALVSGIKAILAEEFSKELSAKIKNAHKRRQQKQTGCNITREMFGWNKIAKDVYEINKEDAEYFYTACHLAEAGYGFRRISNALYEAGARNKNGNRISEVQWRKMLRSERAYGTVVLHKEEYDFELKKRKKLPPEEWIRVENALPPLITEEYHKKLLELLDERAKKQRKNMTRPNNAGKYPLSGKLICGCCESVYYRTGKVSWEHGRKVKKNIWKCSKYLREGTYHSGSQTGCSNRKLEETELLQKITVFFREKTDNNVFEKWKKGDKILIEEISVLLQQLLGEQLLEGDEAEFFKKQKKLQQNKEKLLQKLLDDVITDEEYKRFRCRIESEEAFLESKREKMQEKKENWQENEKRIPAIMQYIEDYHIAEQGMERRLAERIDKIYIYQEGSVKVCMEGAEYMTEPSFI